MSEIFRTGTPEGEPLLSNGTKLIDKFVDLSCAECDQPNKQKINIACAKELGIYYSCDYSCDEGVVFVNEDNPIEFNIFDDTKGDLSKVIEKFHISTECKIGPIWCCWINRSGNTNAYVRHGKTMREAQIACICAVIGDGNQIQS